MLSSALHLDFSPEASCSQAPTFTPSQSRSCGKAILVGEHAVVHGAHAVSIPIKSMTMEISLEPEERSRTALSKATTPHSQNLELVLKDAFRLLQLEPRSLKIRLDSKILFGAGLGASAALCVSVLKALSKSFALDLSISELIFLANQLEQRFHGTPSGLDTATVAMESPLLFRKGSTPQKLHVREYEGLPWAFALIDSGTRSPTWNMVKQTTPFFTQSESSSLLAAFDSAALEACTALEEGLLSLMKEAFQRSHKLLDHIGVVPSSLHTLIEQAETCGALAAKVTGAGGGGCVLALLDPHHAQETYTKLQKDFGVTSVHKVLISGS